MSRILISGSSGFIGKALSSYLLSQGHSIVKLKTGRGEEKEVIYWDPEKGEVKIDDLEGFDAVIHLAGEPFTIGRWSRQKKMKVKSSRVHGTKFLSQSLAHTQSPPKTFISASAIGFYGDRGEEILTEKSLKGTGFLSDICNEWEHASSPLSKKGIRTVQTRFGMVIGKGARGLESMIMPYKLCLGGNLGNGQQWVSWIALEDLIKGIENCLNKATFQGPVNFTSPNPVRQEEFSKTFAELLNRPSFLTMPTWLVRLQFGILADEMLLASTRVEPAKLLAAGFHFKFPHLAAALREALYT